MLQDRRCSLTLPEEFVVLDIETTGFSITSDRIIEIAAIKYNRHGRIDTFSTLINPCRDIPKVVSNLTGISEQDVELAPVWKEIQPVFLAFIGDAPLVGHNIVEFDIAHINAALGFTLNNQLIDTLVWAKSLFPSLPNHKLENIIKFFHIDISTSHRALADSLATYELLLLCNDPESARNRIDYSVCANERKTYRSHNAIKIGDIQASPDATKNSVLKDKILVFTGSLSIDRKEAMQIAVDAGAIVRSTVSKKTDYLIVGKQDITIVGFDGMSDKEERALALNNCGAAHIQIIDEQTFITLTQTEAEESILCEEPKNPPSPEEVAAFEKIKLCSTTLLQELNIPCDFLILKGITEKSAICMLDENHILSYVRIRKNKKYITFPESVAELIPVHVETYTLKSAPGTIYVPITRPCDVEFYLAAFFETIRQFIQHYHTFDCCGRYMMCSDAKRCIHPSPAEALGCTYKKHLMEGRIFYGQNRNID